MKSKLINSLSYIAFSCSTVFDKLLRWMSGAGVGDISFMYVFSVYRQKQFSGPVRPALPLRCIDDAFEMGVTTRESIRIFELYTLCLEKPGSVA